MFSNMQFTRIAQYNNTLPTLADGDFAPLQVDDQGRLIVSQDVNVSIDFLGLNGASDSSNILMVGTEDGTGAGTPHAARMDAGGRLITKLSDGTNEIQIVKEDEDISVNDDGVVVYGKNDSDEATSLKFDAADNLKVVGQSEGSDANGYADVAGDGVVENIDNTFTDLVTDIAVPAGQTLYIYGVYGESDKDAFFRLVSKTGGSEDGYYLLGHSKDNKSYDPRVPERTPIAIPGGATVTVNLQARRMQGSAANLAASGTIFARLV